MIGKFCDLGAVIFILDYLFSTSDNYIFTKDFKKIHRYKLNYNYFILYTSISFLFMKGGFILMNE